MRQEGGQRKMETLNGLTFEKFLMSLMAGLGAWWAGVPHSATVLAWVMVADLVFGAIAAKSQNEFSRRKLWWGIIRKLLAFPVIGVAVVACQAARLGNVTTILIDALIVYEALSVLYSHVKLKGPGWKFLSRIMNKLEAVLDARRDAEEATDGLRDRLH